MKAAGLVARGTSVTEFEGLQRKKKYHNKKYCRNNLENDVCITLEKCSEGIPARSLYYLEEGLKFENNTNEN